MKTSKIKINFLYMAFLFFSILNIAHAENVNKKMALSTISDHENSYPKVNGGPLNYETQALEIFRAASGNGGPVSIIRISPNFSQEKKEVLNDIYEKLKLHEMFLKNVVWRPDLKVIRITWADNSDSLVFKIVYRVSEDPVLRNSMYADKQQILDIKIMYLKGGEYHYIHLDHAPRTKDSWGFANITNDSESNNKVYGPYTLNGNLPKEACAFCHMLVPGVNGKPGGIFFPRYQESYLASKYAMKSPSFFDFSSFKLIESKTSPIPLPKELPSKILFRQVGSNEIRSRNDMEQMTMYTRTLFESPEIFEAMARDNHASMCMSVDFGEIGARVFGRDNYVCADNENKKLYVRYKNERLSTGNGLIEYVIPYYGYKENTARSTP